MGEVDQEGLFLSWRKQQHIRNTDGEDPGGRKELMKQEREKTIPLYF